MPILTVFSVLGGLAIFIYGMKLMSEGLHKAAGSRMRSVLHFFSSNRFVAIMSGTLVTAVIQSSSATTVMVVGFINAGLLNLMQAIGIIFGANIGTTITAQLIAFDIGWLIMPAIAIGVLFCFITHPALRGWGDTILGFGFLFFGMSIMSSELKVLAQNQEFIAFFQTFNCAPQNGSLPPGAVFGAIGIGVLVTMLVQSSSACSGIVIALGASGLIDLYTAVALILGSNIGTTITAQIAAIPANRVAKQAALAHTLFNVFGVLICVGTFWIHIGDSEMPICFQLVEYLSASGSLPRKIANAHTIFNVGTTLILIPFMPLLAHLCEKIIPVRAAELKYQYLEPHLLNTPSIALSQTISTLRRMLGNAWVMIDCAINTYSKNTPENQKMADRLDDREEEIDALQVEITDYLSRLMQQKLMPAQADAIPLLIHCTNDTERIGDHTAIILDQINQIKKTGVTLSEMAEREMDELQELLAKQAEVANTLLIKYSPEKFALAVELEEKINSLTESFESNHLERIKEGTCLPVIGVYYIQLLAEFQKISRHLANIADRSREISTLA
ncbi:MAG: Na/Pi cotransporter family protein [Lentisphaerae bacterium]|jgi:Na/Pi-cotransporter|nr:Na/Pi cotransporter family protein [Lentisphaerota bacterium]